MKQIRIQNFKYIVIVLLESICSYLFKNIFMFIYSLTPLWRNANGSGFFIPRYYWVPLCAGHRAGWLCSPSQQAACSWGRHDMEIISYVRCWEMVQLIHLLERDIQLRCSLLLEMSLSPRLGWGPCGLFSHRWYHTQLEWNPCLLLPPTSKLQSFPIPGYTPSGLGIRAVIYGWVLLKSWRSVRQELDEKTQELV